MFFNNLFNDFSPFNNYSLRNSERPRTYYNNDTRSIIINKLINDGNNYICFDCCRQINTLKYFDLKNAIFLCYNCALQLTRLPKEISEVMQGDIRTLEENNLRRLYFGGNKNLIDFIRLYYPLLEKMDKNRIYSTKAMDYYRKLIYSKANNEPEPCMPRKLEGYNSIYENKNMTEKKNCYSRNNEEKMETDENNDLYNSAFFGNNPFGKNRTRIKNENLKNEPAVINNKKEIDDDIEMKDDSSKRSEDSTYEDAESDKENKINDKIENKKKENINKNINTFTINQLGEISMYPDALAIEQMD